MLNSDKLKVMSDAVNSIADRYGISSAALKNRLNHEGFVDSAIRRLNGEDKYHPAQSGKNLLYSDKYDGFGHFGTDDVGSFIKNGDVKLINENWYSDDAENEYGRPTVYANGATVADNIGIVAATLAAFKKEAKEKYPNFTDHQAEVYANIRYNRGKTGASNYFKKKGFGEYDFKEYSIGGPLVDAAKRYYEKGGIPITTDPPVKTHQDKIVERAKEKIQNDEIYNNYEDAVDASWFEPMKAKWVRFRSSLPAHPKIIGAGGSNCILNASQWIDPSVPIMASRTLTDNPYKYGYFQLPQEYAVPGDMVIADNNAGSYHAMLLSGFSPFNTTSTLNNKIYELSKGDPLVMYSRGRALADENLVEDAPLKGYLDQSDGKSRVRYYRNIKPGTQEGLLPPIVDTPSKSYIDYNGSVKEPMVYGRLTTN